MPESTPPPIGTPVAILTPGIVRGLTGVVVRHVGPIERPINRDGSPRRDDSPWGFSLSVELDRPIADGTPLPITQALCLWGWEVEVYVSDGNPRMAPRPGQRTQGPSDEGGPAQEA